MKTYLSFKAYESKKIFLVARRWVSESEVIKAEKR